MSEAPQTGQTHKPMWKKPLRRFLKNWYRRHRHPFNLGIHLLGIPLAFYGVVRLCQADWYWGSGAFVLGYVLQYIGHVVEGNDLGEWAAVKRMLGLPYVSISPRWQQEEASTPAPVAHAPSPIGPPHCSAITPDPEPVHSTSNR